MPVSGSLEKEIDGKSPAPNANTPEVMVATPPVNEVKEPVSPVTVAPEICVVKTPEIPVIDVALNVSPVIVAPEICVVKTPETPVSDVY